MNKDEALKLALEALEKLWNIIDDIDTYGDMAKADEKLYRSLVERRQRTRFEETGITTDGYELSGGAITAIKEALAQPEQEPVAQPAQCQCPNCRMTLHASDCAVHNEPAYPKVACNCGAQPEQEPEFFTHNVEQPYDWSEWVCPDPKGYLMKCCDCGLVHEAEFGVVRYKSETEQEDCDRVDDPNLQAVFRMRRSEQWSPEDTAHRAGGLPMEQSAQQEPVLQEIEQYRLQMAGISTAAIGYWKESDGIHPDYDTIALRDVAKLYAKYDELYRAQPVPHAVIAGALFDFMGWLTSRPKRIMLSSADDASPAVEAIRDFAKMRGLSLDDAKAQEWTDKIRART